MGVGSNKDCKNDTEAPGLPTQRWQADRVKPPCRQLSYKTSDDHSLKSASAYVLIDPSDTAVKLHRTETRSR